MAITFTRSPFETSGTRNPLGTLNWVAWALVVIGALNWGALGFFGIDLVASILGSTPMLSRIIYAIVGIAGLYFLSVPFQGDLNDQR